MAKKRLRKGWWRTSRGCACYREGKYRWTVTVQEREPGGVLQARAYDPTLRNGQGGYRRVSLGYRLEGNEERAEEYADDQAAKIKKGLDEIRQSRTTLRRLIQAYLNGRRKKGQQDERRAEMWLNVLGTGSDPHDATEQDMEDFDYDRSTGAIDPRGNPVPEGERKTVRQRAVQADIEWLKAVLKWGCDKARDEQKRRYLREHPLRDYSPRGEKNKRRPIATQDRFEKVMAVADSVHLFLSEVLTIVNNHARRIRAVLALTYEDINTKQTSQYPNGYIAWPGETDKNAVKWNCPMTAELRALFERIMRERPGIGRAPIFPSPGDPSRPVSYAMACRWLRQAEKLVDLKPLKGGRWHPYRRKWATERKHLPDVDVAKAGGWSDLRALKEAYQHDDSSTTLEVLENPKALREVEG